MKYKIIFCVCVLFSIFYFLDSNVAQAAAASMFLSPTSASYSVGQNFSVAVKLNTGGDAVNAAEGKISFDAQRLSLASISKAGSIFSLWTKEPNESDSVIEFGGGVPNPGFTGSSGNIITVNFKAKDPGDTTVRFISGAVLANDGKGTNILSTLGGSNYSINPVSYIPRVQEPVTVAAGTPAAPQIVSPTHPDQDKWYSKSAAEFEWSVPKGVSAVRLLIGTLPTAAPTVLYEPAIAQKTVEDLKDGVYYFHARFRNSEGWGQIAHFSLKIDTVAPEQFSINVDNAGDSTNPSPALKFKTTDATSGIDYYEIKIDTQPSVFISPNELGSKPYVMPPQSPEEHSVLIKAVDRAGNFATASVNVIIKAIEAPVITEYPEQVNEGEQLIIKGTSLPDVSINVFVRKEEDAAVGGKTESDNEGNWRYTHAKSLEKGVYTIWAAAEDARGAQSGQSEIITIAVGSPILLKFGKIAIDYLTTMFTLIVLVLGFAFAVFYGWYRVTTWKKTLRKEVHEAEDSVANAFQALYEDIQEQFDILEEIKSKRALTAEEKKILGHMKKNLKIAEQFIQKEIKDVEKEVE